MTNGRRTHQRFRFALVGTLVGVSFPAASLVLVYAFDAQAEVLLAIIGLALPVLGVVGWLIGVREDRLAALAHGLEQQVAERTAAIRSMLDVTGDGFLTIGPDYRVQPEYSRPCERIFGSGIAGRRLPDLLYVDDAARQEFVEGLDLYFTGRAKADVIFDLLDKRVEVGDRIIQIDYRAIDESTVMCALTDVTEQERLEAAVEEQNRRRDLILRVVSNRKYFAGFLEEANDLFQVLDAISAHRSSQVSTEAAERIAAQLHTFKGNAGFLGFSRTARVAHDLEDALVALPILQNDIDLSSEVFVLKRQYYEEYNAISGTLGDRWINDLATISVPIATVQKIEQYVKSTYTDDGTLQRAMEQLRSVPLAELFSQYPHLVADIASRRGRRVREVEILGGEFRVLPERFEPLASALTHVARNMVDHGIESPTERELKGKPGEGEIKIELKKAGGEITIVFTDDGQGISFAAVEERARTGGLIETDAKPSRAELLGILFGSGFSTADEVTTVSGRGVGLDAVQRAVRRAGGRITVETRPGRGTSFRITVPERAARPARSDG